MPDGHENHGLGFHYVVAPGGDIAYQIPLDFVACESPVIVALAYSSSNTKSRITNASETLMAYTIDTGTMRINGGTLIPESLRFGSEPWTFFYMAGEIIRESRKASGKQSMYGTEGYVAHSDKVIDRYNDPGSVGSLPNDDPNVDTGLLGAAECGDVMKLQMKINSDSETQVIEEAEFKTFGCGSPIARKRWPSRTRISSARSAFFPRATLHDATRHSRIGGRLHLVGSPIF